MNLLFLQSIDTEKLIKAFSLTLLHSLWQAFVIYFLAILVMIFTRKFSAAARYRLLTGFFLVFIFTVSATFYVIYQFSVTNSAKALSEPGFQQDPVPVWTLLVAGCNAYAMQIFIVWLFLCCIKSAWMLLSIRSLQQISRNASEVSPEWQEKILQLANRIRLKRKVRFKLSSFIDQPAVIGFFKPVLLAPLSMLTALPPAETEAILLHELAHIKRRDHLVNFLQNIAAIIFFFNPAVFLLSRMIRKEREYCCDDVAVNVTGDKKIFIRALVSFCEYNLAAQNHALYLAGNNNGLRSRVSRIITGQHAQAGGIEKVSWIFCLLTGICLLSFSTKSIAPADAKEKQKKEIVKNTNTPLPVSGSFFSDLVQKPNGKKQLKIGFSISMGAKKDTVIENRSKEFIAGYEAAQNYRKNSGADPVGKYRIEKQAIRKKPDKEMSVQKDGPDKKEKEARLQNQRVI